MTPDDERVINAFKMLRAELDVFHRLNASIFDVRSVRVALTHFMAIAQQAGWMSGMDAPPVETVDALFDELGIKHEGDV